MRPVFPSDTIRTEIWQAGCDLCFRALEREVIVLDQGSAEIAA
jgi:hypothetical protein